MTTDMETHGPLATNIGVWFAILSPMIGLIVGLLAAWFFSQLGG